MSKLTNQWIELFRAGKHGEKGTFTASDVDQIVANYNPANSEAPCTVGHPTGDAPAYAWINALKREGDVLLGRAQQVAPEFEDAVEAGRFKNRSVGLVKDDKGWNLHHVAFLGATLPHVKGLAPIKFENAQAQVVEITFEEDSMAAETQTLSEKMEAWLQERFGRTAPAATFSEQQVKDFAKAAVVEAIAPLQVKLDAQQAALSERDTVLATAETRARGEAAVTSLKSKGKWVPAFDSLGLPLVFAELAKANVTVEFGEGSAKKSLKPLDALVSFMEQLPAIVPNVPVYTGQTAGDTSVTKVAGINDTQRAPADPNSMTLDSLVQARAREAKIDYGKALAQIAAEKPELTIPGGATAGAV